MRPATALTMSATLLLSALLLGGSAAMADGPSDQVADGLPWLAALPGGRTVEMSFHPDGRVALRAGPFSPRMTWTPTEDGLCLDGGPGGRRCVVLEEQPGGFVGREGEAVTIVLSR